MTALREDNQNPIEQVIKTLEAYYHAGASWHDSDLSEQEFFDTARQTSLLFEHIYDQAAVQNQQVLVFLGPTGTGKSTTIAILQGASVKLEQVPTDKFDEYDEPITCEKYVLSGEAEQSVSNGASKSCTILPKSMGEVPEIPGWTIWDFPGFEDTRSKAFNIGIASGYKALLKRAKRCCLVSCCGPSSISGTNMVDKTVVAAQAIVPAPGPLRSSKCFVSLNYKVDGLLRGHHERLTGMLEQDKIAYFKMDLDVASKGKPVRKKYIEKLKVFLQTEASAIVPNDMDHYTKTMDDIDVQQYEQCLTHRMENSKAYAERVVKFLGITELAESYKRLDLSQDCGYADITKSVKDIGQLKDVCRRMLGSFRAAQKDCQSEVELMQEKMSLNHLNEKISVWANEATVDSTLCDVVKSRDIELVRPINEKEYQTVLKTVETTLAEVLDKHLEKAITAFETDINQLVVALKDPVLLEYFECLADELKVMKENLDIKTEAMDVGSWGTAGFAIRFVSDLLKDGGLALEFAAIGVPVGTEMVFLGAMKVAAFLATEYVSHKEKEEKQQQEAALRILKELGQAVVSHCRFLNKVMNVVTAQMSKKTMIGKAMNSSKAEVNEAIMKLKSQS